MVLTWRQSMLCGTGHATSSSSHRSLLTRAYSSVEVSEYDGQKRPLVSLNSTAGWRWVGGLSAMDYNHYKSGPGGKEWNCASGGCTFYVREERTGSVDPGVIDEPPRRIVGRTLHTGKVVANVTDPTQIATLTYLPKRGAGAQHRAGDIFIGIGVCCELEWCPTECEGHGGELSVVMWGPERSLWPRVVATLGKQSAASQKTALRLGIAMDDFGYPVKPEEYAPRFSVWANDAIISYEITQSQYAVGIKEIARSPTTKFPSQPVMWGYFME